MPDMTKAESARLGAANAQRHAIGEQLERKSSEWTEAKAALTESEDAIDTLMDDIGEDIASMDDDDARRLGSLTADRRRRSVTFAVLDRERRSLGKQLRDMDERVFALLDEIFDPMIGPGHTEITLRDVVGGPRFGGEQGAKAWPSQQLEAKADIVTVPEYLEGLQDGAIDRLVEGGVVSAADADRVALAVYRYLDRIEQIDRWTGPVPVGGQATLLARTEPQEPAELPEPPAEPPAAEAAPEAAETDDTPEPDPEPQTPAKPAVQARKKKRAAKKPTPSYRVLSADEASHAAQGQRIDMQGPYPTADRALKVIDTDSHRWHSGERIVLHDPEEGFFAAVLPDPQVASA